MPGVLIYIDPLLGSLDPTKHLGGALAVGKTLVKCKWDNKNPVPSNQAAHDGMMELDRLLHLYPGTVAQPTVVLGFSAGGEIEDKWCREKLPTTDLTIGALEFWITGDPEQKFTGACYLYPDQTKPVYPGNQPHTANCPTPAQFHGGYGVGYGLPADLHGLKVTVVAAQHDGWADAPVNYSGAEFSRGVSTGIFGTQPMWSQAITCFMKSAFGYHGTYPPLTSAVSYPDPDAPTVTYKWLPTYPVPSVIGVRLIKFLAKLLDSQRRAPIEAGYAWNAATKRGRPVVLPNPNYVTLPSWIPWT